VKSIERVSGLDRPTFLDVYLAENRPVIIQGAMDDWAAREKWTPAFLREEFGEELVQVYDDLTSLGDIYTLGEYIEDNFGRSPSVERRGYVKAYTRFKEVDFVWADEIFLAMAKDWSAPAFFPDSGLVMPVSPPSRALSPAHDLFPYRGLFVSARGERTRLHRDPYDTEAILCQFHGEKQLRFYEPRHQDRLFRDGRFFDPLDKQDPVFADCADIEPDYVDTLRPGEMIFIPGGWFHDVTTLTDSISVTWNFVHQARASGFWRQLEHRADAGGYEVMRFFLDRQGLGERRAEEARR
jgi:hypothetical protein